MDNSVIVSLRDIVVEFDGQRILDGLNLDIHDDRKILCSYSAPSCLS